MVLPVLLPRTPAAWYTGPHARWCRALSVLLFITTVHARASLAVSQPGDRDERRQPSCHSNCGAAEGRPAKRPAKHVSGAVPSHCCECPGLREAGREATPGDRGRVITQYKTCLRVEWVQGQQAQLSENLARHGTIPFWPQHLEIQNWRPHILTQRRNNQKHH